MILNDFADHRQVVVAIADAEFRERVVSGLSAYTTINDIYQESNLLPHFMELPCFFRICDYATYEQCKDEIGHYLKMYDPLDCVPLVVYGVHSNPLLNHIAIINGDVCNPKMLSSFYLDCKKRANS